MQCIILTGGLGTRLYPLTHQVPKTLVEVAGRPFADYQLSWLAKQGVRDVVYAIGHLGKMIRDFVGDGSRWGLSVTYADEGERLRGTAGALRLAVDLDLAAPTFLVLYGDSYLPIDIPPVWKAAIQSCLPVMTVFRNDGRWDSSNVVFSEGRVQLYEKGRSDAAKIGMRHIDYGLSVLQRPLIEEFVPSGQVMDLSTIFHRLSIDGRLLGFEVIQRFYEIGTHQGLAELDTFLKESCPR